MKNILSKTWKDVFTQDELGIFIMFFTDKYERYTKFYKDNPITKQDVDDMNKFLSKLRNKRISEIPKDLPKMEQMKKRRIIIRETKPYTELEVSSQSNANEYIRWIEQIKSNDKINTIALFEYICFTENEPEKCNKLMMVLAKKSKEFRNEYIDLQNKLVKEKKGKVKL